MHHPRHGTLSGLLLILFSATCFGFLPMITRHAYSLGYSPELAHFVRYAIPGVIMLPFLPKVLRLGRGALPFAFTGLSVGLGMIFYLKAIEKLDLAVAGLIFFTFPAFAALVRSVMTLTWPSSRTSLAILLVLGASAMIVGAPQAGADMPLDAVLLAFLAPLAYGVMLYCFAAFPSTVSPATAMAGIAISAFLVVALVVGVSFPPIPETFLTPASFLVMAGLGLVTILIPQLAMSYGAQMAGPSLTAIAAVFELIVTLSTGWFLLQEPMEPVQVIGAGMVILAIFIETRPGRRRVVVSG